MYRYSLPDPWKRRLFLALCRRYGLKPYREPRRRYSTVPVQAPETFHSRMLWPEFEALSEELSARLQELTDRVIREAIDEDVSEAPEGEPKALPPGYNHLSLAPLGATRRWAAASESAPGRRGRGGSRSEELAGRRRR